MRESLEDLKDQLDDEEYRHAYAQSFLNSYVAAQIKFLREQQDLTQAQLAERIGTKQAGISRLENVNHSTWKVDTLTRLAKAFDVRLRISFEEFGTLPDEISNFRRDALQRQPYEKDPVFNPSRFPEMVKSAEPNRASDSSIIAFQARGNGSQPPAPMPPNWEKDLKRGKENAPQRHLA